MNTDKVLIGFNKDGEELLVFRKDNDTFIDLISENNEIYNKEDIDLTSLTLASKSLNLRKDMLADTIKRKYKKDREQLLDTKNYLIGLKVKVINYENWYSGSGIYNKIKHHRWEEQECGYDLYNFINNTKISYNTTLNIYKNVNNELFLGYEEENEPEQLYCMPDFGNGKEYIIIKNNLYKFRESFLEKKLIYETAYKLRKTINYGGIK